MKHLKLFLILLISIIGITTVLSSGSAKAAPPDSQPTSVFPRGGNSMLFVTYYRNGANQETPKSQLRIFYDATYADNHKDEKFTVSVDVFCRGGDGNPGGGVQLGSNAKDSWDWSSRCSGSNYYPDGTPDGAAISQSMKYGDLKSDTIDYGKDYKYVDLVLDVGNSKAAVGAVVRAPRGLITFQEVFDDEGCPDTNNYTGNGTGSRGTCRRQQAPYPIGYGQPNGTFYNAYAIKPINGKTDYSFTFSTNCSITGTDPYPTYIRWYDADWGVLQPQAGQNDANYSFSLIDLDNGSQPVRTNNSNRIKLDNYNDNLGGNDAYRDLPVALVPGHRYVWTWHDVYETNGIQFWLPFSEISSIASCNQKPTGNLTLHCDAGGNSDWYRASGYDPDHPNQNVSYELRRGGDAKDSGTTNQGNNEHRDFAQMADGATYGLWVKDKDDGQWYKVDSATADCPNPNQPNPSCTNYEYHMQGDSYYRFMFFPKNQNYTVDPAPRQGPRSSDPNLSSSSSDNPDFWATYPNADPPKFHMSAVKHTDGNGGNYSYNFPDGPPGPDVKVYIEHWEKGSDGKWTNRPIIQDVAATNCYGATCANLFTIDQNVPGTGAGSNAVQAGQSFRIHVSIKNTGSQRLPDTYDGAPLQIVSVSQLNGGVDGGTFNVNHSPYIASGRTYAMDSSYPNGMFVTAPGEVAATQLAYFILYPGKFIVGGCAAPVNVYKHFGIDVQADTNLSPNDENPTSILYTAKIHNIEGTAAVAPVQSSFTRDGAGLDAASAGGPYGGGDTYMNSAGGQWNNKAASPGAFTVGTQYCTTIHANWTQGWLGPGNDVKGETGELTRQDCPKVHNEPYIHAFGGDVSAGGGYGDNDSCTTSIGTIQTYAGTTGEQPTGSGVQLGALSVGPITGFSSALLRHGNGLSTSPIGSTGLTFANTTVSGGYMGGSLGPPHCVREYFDNMKKEVKDAKTPAPSADIDLSDSGYDGAHYYDASTGTPLKIKASSTIAAGKRITIYVKGNVILDSNLIYAYDAARPGDGKPVWSGLEKIPSLAVIVKGGSIYTKNNVNQLDGVYVSEPGKNDAGVTVGGNIYTCATGTARLSGTQIYSSCRQQLVVNGAFVANKVYLDRSYGSLRYSTAGERYSSSPVNKNCGDSGNTILGDCAAEIFNFSPEMYLSQFSLPPPGGPTTTKYDAITSLSPVL